MNASLLFQVPPPPPPPPLLATTGTELLELGLLVAAGVLLAKRYRLDPAGFVARALLFVSAFYFLWPQDGGPLRGGDRLVMQGMAAIVSVLLNLGGLTTSVDGVAVLTPAPYVMARGCMGLSYLAMAVLCTLSFPGGWRRRVAGTLAVAGGMVGLNALRIVLLFHLWKRGEYDLHAWVHRAGGVFFAIFALGLFIAAVRRRTSVVPHPAPAPDAVPGVSPADAR